MKRTINEKKALRYIYLTIFLNIFGFGLFGYMERTMNIIGVAFALGIYGLSLGILCYNCYSLGWEYKRISKEEQNEIN